MRLRITFVKNEAMRYTGHLDLHRAWERVFRRAALPLAYSQGFHPQPRINLASALPLGFTSECELVDIWLEKELPLLEIRAALTQALPPGIQVLHLAVADQHAPALQTQVKSAYYIITLLDLISELNSRVNAVLAVESLPRERRGKSYDLRPLILELQCLSNDEQGLNRLAVQLKAEAGATGRPEEVLAALGIPAEATRIHRVRLIL